MESSIETVGGLDATPMRRQHPNRWRVFKQAKVHLKSRKVVGHEVLVRPEGMRSGGAFYEGLRNWPPQRRLLVELDILRASLVAAGAGPCSVNVSLPTLLSRRGQQMIITALDCHNRGDLTLELLETDPPDFDAVGCAVGRMVRHGAKIALDDFGKEYASLLLISALPALDEIKVDGRIVNSKRAASILPGVVKIASDLGAVTTAEHVETRACHDMVLGCGVDYGQGFYYGMPTQDY